MEYTEMLKQEFLDRKRRRPSYSERAFARDLRVSPSYVSLLFRGRRVMSPTKGFQVAQRLGWPEHKTDQFIQLIQAQGLRRPLRPSRQLTTSERFQELDLDKFRFIADLNHLALLSLARSREVADASAAAAALGISLTEAELAISRLVRLGLLSQKDNRLQSQKHNLEIKEAPSEAIRALHRQSLARAEEAIDEQSIAERNLAALTLSFDFERMDEAKIFITRFLKAFQKRFGDVDNGEIYQLNTQFFRISSKGSKA